MLTNKAKEIDIDETFDDEFFIGRAVSIMLIGARPKRDLIVGLGPDVLSILKRKEAQGIDYILYIPHCFAYSYAGVIEEICTMKNVRILTNSPLYLHKMPKTISLGKNWTYDIGKSSCVFWEKGSEALLVSENFFETTSHVSTLVICLPQINEETDKEGLAEYLLEFDEDTQKCIIYDTCTTKCIEANLLQ